MTTKIFSKPIFFKAQPYMCFNCSYLKYKRYLFVFCLICFHKILNLKILRIITMFHWNLSNCNFRLICQKMSYIIFILELIKKKLYLRYWYEWNINFQSFLTQYYMISPFNFKTTAYFNLWGHYLFHLLNLNDENSHKDHTCSCKRFLDVQSNVEILYILTFKNNLRTCSTAFILED